MPHRTSAAALHAARVILRNFDLEVIPPEQLASGRIPGLKADEANLSVVIDLMSNVFEVAALRPEFRHWQKSLFAGTATAPQIANFLQKCCDAFAKIPRDPKSVEMEMDMPAEFGRPSARQQITKASREAARGIFHYYRVTAKDGAFGDLLHASICKHLEASLNVSGVDPAYPMLLFWKEELRANRASVEDLKKAFRKIGILLEGFPKYEEREEESKLLV